MESQFVCVSHAVCSRVLRMAENQIEQIEGVVKELDKSK